VPPPKPDPDIAKPDPKPDPTPVDPPAPPKPDTPPEVFAPKWKKVGVGQTVHFSVAAIDQDLDDTAVNVTKLPASAKFDAITQTVSWTPTKDDLPKGVFELTITQPGRNKTETKTWEIEVDKKKQPEPVAEKQSAIIETLLMIRETRRLEQVNKDWPLDKMLLVGAETFKYQIAEDKRKTLEGKLDKKQMFEDFLVAFAQTHQNPRLDPKSPKFDKAVFGDPAAWKIVAVRPRIDRAWTELRVVYRAVKAPEPTFAMFRLRPTVEYVPALPRPAQERIDNNKVFLGMVQKHLLAKGAPNPKFATDQAAHGKAVSALLTELMAYDESAKQPYLRGFMIGIALEAQLGGGSARNADGSYKHGDAWGWSAQKPFQTADGKTQKYVNVVIPGFWTKTVPIDDGKSWGPACADKYVLGEENGMTCSQCHIRNFGMHDYSDPANVDPSKGMPKGLNKSIATLNFQIVPSTHWEEFTLEFLKHQECRGKQHLEEFLGPDAAKGFGCPLAKN
jgi:hypothetical protein